MHARGESEYEVFCLDANEWLAKKEIRLEFNLTNVNE